MGRGIIKSNLGEGLYRVEIDLDTARIVSRREELQRQNDQLDIDITAQENTISTLEAAWQTDPDDTEKLSTLLTAREELAHMYAMRAAARSAWGLLQGANTQDPILDLWCADYTTDLAVGKYVGLAEVPGELRFINMRPAYDGRADYTQSRDGAMNPALNLPPASAVLYWALRPSWQRYHPTYRYGTIIALDDDADIASVSLDAMASSDQTVDVNVNLTLTDIPVQYMDCNAAAFKTDDNVLVEFPNLSWESARVVGFRRNPRPCRFCDYIRFTLNGTPLLFNYGRARVMDAETGLFIPLPGGVYPERIFENDLMYVGDLELNGNQYVDFNATPYSLLNDEFVPSATQKRWHHNKQVFPQFVDAGDVAGSGGGTISELTSEDLFCVSDNLDRNISLPNLTEADAGRIIRAFCSIATNRFYLNSLLIEPGQMRPFIWTGTEWARHGNREINYIQRRGSGGATTGLTIYCSSWTYPRPQVYLRGYNNAWAWLDLDGSATTNYTRQVNWILHPELLLDATVTKEEVDGEIVRIANLDYTGMVINQEVQAGQVCDKLNTTLPDDGYNVRITTEKAYLGYTSVAGGISESPTPLSGAGTNGFYSLSQYCDVNSLSGCFGWYVSVHTITDNDLSQICILTDDLGRSPSFSSFSVELGAVYGDTLTGELAEVAPKERQTYTMIPA